jgi:uncharacterized protein (DUF1697 family)
MSAYVALLRGVNVGKARRMPMAALRELLADLGYQGVVTLLNSGNAVFRAPRGSSLRHARAISAALATRLGLEVPVTVLSAAQFRAVVGGNPFRLERSEHPRLLAAFAQDSRGRAVLRGLAALVEPPERFASGTQASYLYCAKGILQSRAARALLGGRRATSRNWSTVLRIAVFLEASSAGAVRAATPRARTGGGRRYDRRR